MAAGNTTYGGASLTSDSTPITIENILDKIAESIIISPHIDINPSMIRKNQKTIRNGIISTGRQNSEILTLFQKDVKANAEDLQSTDGGETLLSIINTINEFGGKLETTQVVITRLGNNASSINLIYLDLNFDITNILSKVTTNDDNTQTILNPLNVSQFINIEEKNSSISSDKANEYLDTNIYELLPDSVLRQDQINQLFIDVNSLLPSPPSDSDYGLDGVYGRINRNVDGEWEASEQYYLDNSITAPQDNPNLETIDEEDAYITRINKNENDDNSSKTIESLRDRLNLYLKDIDEQPVPPQDERPIYENKSDGYLKFRNLNQGIIIRNTDSKYIDGLNPETQNYLQTGFTVTMWVRFLDKKSQGTLFNFGNPVRDENPLGFKLETFVVNGNDIPTHNNGSFLDGFSAASNLGSNGTWKEIFQDGNPNNLNWNIESGGAIPSEGFFSNSDTERFVRLVVKDGNNIYGSHTGTPFMKKRLGIPEFGNYDYHTDGNIDEGIPAGVIPYDHAYGLMTNVRIPVNFSEWYFICATFNPLVQEQDSNFENRNTDYWRNNMIEGNFVLNSELGNKSKIEIISRTDLLRARGYKV